VILFLAAMTAEHEEALRPGRVVRSNQATIACPTEVFRGEEAKASKIAKGADEAIVVAGADGLRGVFDYQERIGAGDFQDGSEIGGQSKEVHGHDGARLGSDGLGDQSRIDVE